VSKCISPSVLYPITIGDFILADISDAALTGVVASFPSYYRSHIGATDGMLFLSGVSYGVVAMMFIRNGISDGTYQRCYSAYMSMQCANAFPVRPCF
jgi:hypothetical protein